MSRKGGASSECSLPPLFLNHTRPYPFHQWEGTLQGYLFVLMLRRKGPSSHISSGCGFLPGFGGGGCGVHHLHLLCHHALPRLIIKLFYIYWENVKQSLNGVHAELATPCAFSAEEQPFGTGLGSCGGHWSISVSTTLISSFQADPRVWHIHSYIGSSWNLFFKN